MMEPAFYPKPPKDVTHKETHISHVFLAGELVYKVKKPVQFSFLDFSTLAKRRHFLQEELRLNRRLAPSVYLGVMPLFFDRDGWRLGGRGEAAEYTLAMRRLPEKRMLDFLLETKQVTAAMMEQLADRLVEFHAAAEPIRGITPDAHVAAARGEWSKNLDELEPLAPPAGRRDRERIGQFGARFLEENSALIARRAADGWVRDVHGDLHAEHICFAPEGIQIFDCIEFSDELRRCDLAAEIAFLLMDMSVRGGEPLVGPFVRRYLERLNDPGMTPLLPFYQCYRALVRAKVHALRVRKWNDEAARYFNFALRFTWDRLPPFLALVCGLTGSGKSTLARALSARLGTAVINSDEVRKRIAGKPGRHAAALNQGIYTEAMTEKTYRAMAREAEGHIKNGYGIIVDATFGRRSHREKFARLAGKHRIPLLVLHCSASDAATAKRLDRRASEGKDISDGRWDIYVAQKADYQPLEEIPARSRLELRTDAPMEKLVADAEAFLWSRLDSR